MHDKLALHVAGTHAAASDHSTDILHCLKKFVAVLTSHSKALVLPPWLCRRMKPSPNIMRSARPTPQRAP